MSLLLGAIDVTFYLAGKLPLRRLRPDLNVTPESEVRERGAALDLLASLAFGIAAIDLALTVVLVGSAENRMAVTNFGIPAIVGMFVIVPALRLRRALALGMRSSHSVRDVPKARAFYHETLGLTIGREFGDHWVEFDVGGVAFGIGNGEPMGIAPGSAFCRYVRNRRRRERTRAAPRARGAGDGDSRRPRLPQRLRYRSRRQHVRHSRAYVVTRARRPAPSARSFA